MIVTTTRTCTVTVSYSCNVHAGYYSENFATTPSQRECGTTLTDSRQVRRDYYRNETVASFRVSTTDRRTHRERHRRKCARGRVTFGDGRSIFDVAIKTRNIRNGVRISFTENDFVRRPDYRYNFEIVRTNRSTIIRS